MVRCESHLTLAPKCSAVRYKYRVHKLESVECRVYVSMVIGLLPKLEPLCHCPGCGRRWGFVLSPSRLPRVSWCQHPQFVSPAVFLAKVSRRRPASVCIRTLLIHFSDEDPTAPHPSPSPLTSQPLAGVKPNQRLSISAQSGNQVTLSWTLWPSLYPEPSRPTPHRHHHPCDCPALTHPGVPREVHRLFAPFWRQPSQRASPKRSRPPPHLRPGPPSLTPAPLRSASRLPAWACRPSPGSRSALTSRTAEQRHRPPTRHANCNPPSALPWVGAAALRSHQSRGTTCRSSTRKTPAPRFRSQLHPDVDGAGSGHGRHARR